MTCSNKGHVKQEGDPVRLSKSLFSNRYLTQLNLKKGKGIGRWLQHHLPGERENATNPSSFYTLCQPRGWRLAQPGPVNKK